MNIEELIDIVDENDTVTGTIARKDHTHQIIRNVVVVLQDSLGYHILQIRSPLKKRWPGSYDFAACGGVQSKETYEQAAIRELFEELGVRCSLRLLTKLYREVAYDGTIRRHFTCFFHGVYDGEFNPNEEVSGVVKIPPTEFEFMISQRAPLVEDYLVDEWGIVKKSL